MPARGLQSSSSGWMLATDLDGTLLGGTAVQRDTLYALLRARDDLTLVFVTGRDIGFIAELLRTPGMPRPRYIVGDVGTSVYDGATLEPIEALEAEIAARWNGATPVVHRLLADTPGLTLQPTPFRYRVSYDYDPATALPSTAARVEAAGFDCLISADRFLDVLPRGVAKGPTLTRLVASLGHPRVLVAGDTLNDLSLFQTGFEGVVVGNAEPSLLEHVAAIPTVYRSPLPGAGGILDALHHFALIEGG